VKAFYIQTRVQYIMVTTVQKKNIIISYYNTIYHNKTVLGIVK